MKKKSQRKKSSKRSSKTNFPIVIDEKKGLIFYSEEDLKNHFASQIERFMEVFENSRKSYDNVEDEIDRPMDEITETLQEPDEIWEKADSAPVYTYVRYIKDLNAFHVVATVVDENDSPAYILFHCFTRDWDLVDTFRRNEIVYNKDFESVEFAAVEGDSLSDGDPLAIGLFKAMQKIRSEKDVAEKSFKDLANDLREPTIEHPDEIWKSIDHKGNVFVNFIKEFNEYPIKDMHYIAVTQEDSGSGVHSLLFSFPTTDLSLVDRYRQGENLQAEEVSQESSH